MGSTEVQLALNAQLQQHPGPGAFPQAACPPDQTAACLACMTTMSHTGVQLLRGQVMALLSPGLSVFITCGKQQVGCVCARTKQRWRTAAVCSRRALCLPAKPQTWQLTVSAGAGAVARVHSAVNAGGTVQEKVVRLQTSPGEEQLAGACAGGVCRGQQQALSVQQERNPGGCKAPAGRRGGKRGCPAGAVAVPGPSMATRANCPAPSQPPLAAPQTVCPRLGCIGLQVSTCSSRRPPHRASHQRPPVNPWAGGRRRTARAASRAVRRSMMGEWARGHGGKG